MKNYLIIALLLPLSACMPGPQMISNSHHPESKFERFTDQCIDEDLHVCIYRYNQLAVQ